MTQHLLEIRAGIRSCCWTFILFGFTNGSNDGLFFCDIYFSLQRSTLGNNWLCGGAIFSISNGQGV
jgi:hypothetical protein